MLVETSREEAIKSEGRFTREKIDEMVRRGKPLLEGSGLVDEEREIGPREVELGKELLETIAPIDKNNFRLHDHLRLTCTFARKIAERLGLNPNEFEVRGLFHDIGRFVTHRYFRNDLLGDLLLRELGVKKSFLAKMPSLRGYVGPMPIIYKSIEDLSVEQRIIDIADLCAKRKDDGDIRTFDEVMEYHRSSRSRYEDLTGLAATWPTEKYAFSHMLPDEQSGEKGIIERSAEIYEGIKDWLAGQGIDVNEIRQEILEEESKSKVQAVIFDVGGVLIPNPDPKIKENFAQAFAVEPEQINQLWKNFITLLQTGEISEEEFWQRFSEMVGKPLPENYQNLWIKDLPLKIDPEIRALIQRLEEKGYRLAIISDTIPSHQEAFEKAGIYDEFSVKILSPKIKTQKDSFEAFRIAALKLGLPPRACLVIDDSQTAIKNAQEARMQGVQFQSSDQLERELTAKNLL